MSKRRKISVHFAKLVSDLNLLINLMQSKIPTALKEIKTCFSVVPGDVQIAYNNLGNFMSRFDAKTGALLQTIDSTSKVSAIPVVLGKLESTLLGIDDMFSGLKKRYRDNSTFLTVIDKVHSMLLTIDRWHQKLINESMNIIHKYEWLDTGIKNRSIGTKIQKQRMYKNMS